ncbi:MAG: exopolyphosphatase [Bacilli bacterium]|nr:exopolyphosphatase [Bacilli bacterium]
MMSQKTDVSYEQQLIQAKQFIRENDDFLVVSHIDPDGDAASSTLAVGWMLTQLNKRFTMINEGNTPGKFDFLWGFNHIINYTKATPSRMYSHVIAVDCADYSRIGKVKSLMNESTQILNIDHHRTNDYYGAIQLINANAAATAEVLYDLALKLEVNWTSSLGDCIYTGLLTDTGGFRYANTTPKVMRIAAEMLQYGVNGNDLADRLLEKVTYSHILLLQKALSTLSFSENKQISWVSVTKDEIAFANASNEDLEGLVNYPRNIEGIEVGILFKEVEPLKYKVSMRSAGKADVALIAKSFGGGGHFRAAGCTLLGSLEDIIAKVVKEVGLALQ